MTGRKQRTRSKSSSSAELNNNSSSNNNNGKMRKKKKLKVLIVTPVYPPIVSVGGGVAITYGALYDKLVARGHSVSVASPRRDNLDWGTTPLYMGHPVIFASRANFRFLAEQFDKHDVVVCPDNDLLPFLIFMAHWKEKPLLFNTHTNFRMILEGGPWAARHLAAPIMDYACNLCSNLAPFAYTTSPSYRDVLLKRGYKIDGVFSPRIKLSIFERDTDTEEEIAQERKWLMGGVKAKYVLVSVGRWSHEKRIHLLTNAIPENCVLVVVGDGPENEAKKIVALHNPSKRIVIHRGMVNQDRLRVIYKASDVLVSASAFETLGMTVAEAHLCGIPAVVQSAPGFVTQVVQGENGFLVDFASKDILDTVKDCVSRLPSKEQIKRTIDSRWDSKLPNLEDVVEEVATHTVRSEWKCIGSHIPMPFWWIGIFIYYFTYKLMSFPFLVDRENSKGGALNPGSVMGAKIR